MQKKNVNSATESFAVLSTGKHTQTAVMRLAPGEKSGEKGNEHAPSDQVLYVVKGELVAEVGSETETLREGDAVIVAAGIPHQFRNEGSTQAISLNVYSPPAY